jgi:hypothetical protein
MNFLFFKDRYNMALPEWTKKYFPIPMKDFSDFSFQMKAYNLEMQRLRCICKFTFATRLCGCLRPLRSKIAPFIRLRAKNEMQMK